MKQPLALSHIATHIILLTSYGHLSFSITCQSFPLLIHESPAMKNLAMRYLVMPVPSLVTEKQEIPR